MHILPFFAFMMSMILTSSASNPPEPPLVDYEDSIQDFVLETKRIDIPGYPTAFNPSIINWKGAILMTFRVIPDPKYSYISYIGYIRLDEEFNPVGEARLFDLRADQPAAPSRAEDARLIAVGDTLYMIYSDNPDLILSGGGFRVYIAELFDTGDELHVVNKERLSQFEGEKPTLREKSWVPFSYKDNLLLAYSLEPHKIFMPLSGNGECETIALTERSLDWKWGIVRGGTPGLLLDEERYLAFFHSSIRTLSVHSEGKYSTHYFIGAYLFSAEIPFEITHVSPEPIVGPNFYHGISYKPYWKPVKAVFPCGYIMDGDTIWMAYGRDDYEVWVVKLDKAGLLQSLVPVFETQNP